MLTVREYASRHGLTARRITGLCKAGKIAGAVKKDSRWMILEKAPAQILSRKYDVALSDAECFAFGIAFSGKKAAVSSRIIR